MFLTSRQDDGTILFLGSLSSSLFFGKTNIVYFPPAAWQKQMKKKQLPHICGRNNNSRIFLHAPKLPELLELKSHPQWPPDCPCQSTPQFSTLMEFPSWLLLRQSCYMVQAFPVFVGYRHALPYGQGTSIFSTWPFNLFSLASLFYVHHVTDSSQGWWTGFVFFFLFWPLSWTHLISDSFWDGNVLYF